MTVRIMRGHVLKMLAQLEDESVHCTVTSPPYWGLRAYGTEPQVWGARPYSTAVENAGTCEHEWGGEGKSGQRLRNGIGGTLEGSTVADGMGETIHPSTGAFCAHCNAWRGELGGEPTPSLYIEHLVAVFAAVRRVLRKDGTLFVVIGDSYAAVNRRENARPRRETLAGKIQESNPHSDQPTRREVIVEQKAAGIKVKDLIGIPWRLAFALQDDGWYLRRDIIWAKPNAMPESVQDRCTTSHEYVFHLSKSERYFFDGDAIKERAESDRPAGNIPGFMGSQGGSLRVGPQSGGYGSSKPWRDIGGTRNKRSVWTVATVPSSVAHFATYPPALIEPCVLAGCPAGGTILDPFLGVGTTAMVADRLGRNCIGIELSPTYAAIAERRARSPGFPLEFPDAAE